MEYLVHVAIILGIYMILAVSLDLIAGYTGLLSLAHAAFFGVGAYVAALMALRLESPFVVNLVMSIAAAGIFGAVVGVPSLRIRDDYFVIASFCFQIITFSVLNNWVSLTGGPVGLPGIPQPHILGIKLSSDEAFLILVAVLCVLTLSLAHRLVTAPFGRVLKAVREDEVLAQSLGKNVAWFKITVFVLGASLASSAGVLYAYYISFIDPSSFTVMESILVLSMVIIGGAGNIWGACVGAVMLVMIPEALRFVGLPASVGANVREMLYGALLIFCMMFRPQGIIGKYSFGSR